MFVITGLLVSPVDLVSVPAPDGQHGGALHQVAHHALVS